MVKFNKYLNQIIDKLKIISFNQTPKTIKSPQGTSKNNKLYSFHAKPQKTISEYLIAGAIVMITPNYEYLVNEPHFSDEKSLQAYEKILEYKQIRKYSDESVTIENLLNAAEIAASELGFSEQFNKNSKIFEYYLNRDVLGYGLLNVMMNDRKHLEDITCSNWNSVGVMHRDFLEHEVLRSNVKFDSREHMETYLEDLARLGGKHISDSDPIIDVQLDNIYRVAIICSDTLSPKSPCFSIRLKSEKPLTLKHMFDGEIIPYSVIAVIWKFFDVLGTGLIVGGTGAGKSSLLNSLFPLLPKSAKIITIEDTAELQVPQYDWTPLIIDASITSDDYTKRFEFLLDAILRHRPKMVGVGEVRGKSAKKLFDVISTGHSALSSFHAYSAEGAKQRLITEIGVDEASLTHLWFILNMATIITREKKIIRKCVSFDEVYFDGKKTTLVNLCRYNPSNDTFEGGDINNMISKSTRLSYASSLDASTDMKSDLNDRIDFLKQIIIQNADTPRKVMNLLSKYYDKKFSQDAS
jgi:archaeal flagellar protein FlaI